MHHIPPIDKAELNQQKSQTNLMNSGLFGPPDKDFDIKESINYRDILAWRDRQDEWKALERLKKTQINSSLEIKTNMGNTVTIPIEASLKKPTILAET